eukprot:CAMPEP_0117503518 /NCGR_PEP_ID=MMETSP0784-20121206/24373_1 /TAXON_ID=39447 /ORGANISM="" /LENGTH=223 /DNA_ID=CAMNT_0005298841 /DNA_START=383 /DNA_END=1054 /DNA_ORIENTATION=+
MAAKHGCGESIGIDDTETLLRCTVLKVPVGVRPSLLERNSHTSALPQHGLCAPEKGSEQIPVSLDARLAGVGEVKDDDVEGFGQRKRCSIHVSKALHALPSELFNVRGIARWLVRCCPCLGRLKKPTSDSCRGVAEVTLAEQEDAISQTERQPQRSISADSGTCFPTHTIIALDIHGQIDLARDVPDGVHALQGAGRRIYIREDNKCKAPAPITEVSLDQNPR